MSDKNLLDARLIFNSPNVRGYSPQSGLMQISPAVFVSYAYPQPSNAEYRAELRFDVWLQQVIKLVGVAVETKLAILDEMVVEIDQGLYSFVEGTKLPELARRFAAVDAIEDIAQERSAGHIDGSS